MSKLKELRAKYPQYNDMPDEELADKFHAKYYSDMPIEEFDRKLGLQRKSGAAQADAAARRAADRQPHGC
jgi:hypothetical protein